MAVDGLITLRSAFDPKETMARLEAEVRAKGMTVFAHIDHAAGAAAAGLPLRPTDLLIFGAAKGGTPLMQAVQTIGIDLPLKALFERTNVAQLADLIAQTEKNDIPPIRQCRITLALRRHEFLDGREHDVPGRYCQPCFQVLSIHGLFGTLP